MYEQARELLADRQPPVASDASAEMTDLDTEAWTQAHSCPVCGQPLIVCGYLPSSLTGKVIPRVSLGHCFAQPPPAGGVHAP